MVFRVANRQLKAFQFQTTTKGKASTMTAGRILTLVNLHLAAATEVITTRDKDGGTETDVGTYGKVLDECLIPVVQARQGGMQREW